MNLRPVSIGAVGLAGVVLVIFGSVPAAHAQCPPIAGSPPAPVVPPQLFKSFGAASIPVNGTTTLTFSLNNPNCLAVLSEISFTDQLPPGLIIATPNGLTNLTPSGPAPACNATITAEAGSSTISLTDGSIFGVLLPGPSGCAFTVNVTGTSLGTKNNTTSAVTTAVSEPGPPALASLDVVGVVPVPTLSAWAFAALATVLTALALRVLRARSP